MEHLRLTAVLLGLDGWEGMRLAGYGRYECNGLIRPTDQFQLNFVIDCQRIHDLFASLPRGIPVRLRAFKNEHI
jgi:hypothetical protein